MTNSHKGKCFCGAVEIEVSGDPMGMGYCHCESCRAWASARVHSWTAWQPQAVVVTKGEDNIGSFSNTENSDRRFCKKCGSNIMTLHPTMGMTDVCAGTLPTLNYEPGLHTHYSETVNPMADGLPKFKDMPADFGGSGDILPE